MELSSEVGSKLVSEEAAKWDAGPYQHTIRQLEQPGSEGFHYVVTFSKPRKGRPVPPVAVHLYVDVFYGDSKAVQTRCRFEREKTSFTPEEVGKLLLPRIEELMARKERSVDDLGLKLVDSFESDRLPSSYAADAPEEPTEEEKSAILIQRAGRGKLARKRVAAIREERHTEDAAATKVQSVVRGRHARKQVSALKGERHSTTAAEGSDEGTAAGRSEEGGSMPLDGVDLDDEDVQKSVVQIQRMSRGKLARKRVKHIKEEKSAIQMQRIARGRGARKRVAELRAAKSGDADEAAGGDEEATKEGEE